MAEQYTKNEIIAMADRCYNRCNHCERYEAVSHDTVHSIKRIFEWANSGCYYSSCLPWDDARWCWFWGPKRGNEIEAQTLRSLTWENLVNSVCEKSR